MDAAIHAALRRLFGFVPVAQVVDVRRDDRGSRPQSHRARRRAGARRCNWQCRRCMVLEGVASHVSIATLQTDRLIGTIPDPAPESVVAIDPHNAIAGGPGAAPPGGDRKTVAPWCGVCRSPRPVGSQARSSPPRPPTSPRSTIGGEYAAGDQLDPLRRSGHMTSLIAAPCAIVRLESRLCALRTNSAALQHPPPQGGLRTPLLRSSAAPFQGQRLPGPSHANGNIPRHQLIPQTAPSYV